MEESQDKNGLSAHTADRQELNRRLEGTLIYLTHLMRFLHEGRGSQKRILILLLENDGITQRKLTEQLGIQSGSASEVIGKLEATGFISRTENGKDRRTVNITLTDAGQAAAKEALAEQQKRQRSMFASLTEEECRTLLSLTETLCADWEKHRPASSGRSRKDNAPHHGSFGREETPGSFPGHDFRDGRECRAKLCQNARLSEQEEIS